MERISREEGIDTRETVFINQKGDDDRSYRPILMLTVWMYFNPGWLKRD